MDFYELAQKRYSCRKFSDKPVEQEKIDKIIEVANLAPTAVNNQPFVIWNMKSDAAKEAIRQSTKCHFGANTFLVVGASKDLGWDREYDNHNFAEVDASIVATHMMLEIKELGLDTTWVGWFDAPKLQELMPKMKGYELIAVFPIGYAAEDAKPSIRHDERKRIKDIVVEL